MKRSFSYKKSTGHGTGVLVAAFPTKRCRMKGVSIQRAEGKRGLGRGRTVRRKWGRFLRAKKAAERLMLAKAAAE